jgi:SAM-dependent methyltransferase
VRLESGFDDGGASYRTSHAAEGYGQRYAGTYQKGYYHHQWKLLEEPLLRELLKESVSSGARRALDFACGTGRILRVLEDYFANPSGVDVSESMLRVAAAACTRSALLYRDITTDSLPDRYDVATAFRFFVNAEERLRHEALRAIHASLNPGGVLIANVHQNATSPLGLAYRLRNRVTQRKTASVLSYPEFAALLDQEKFKVIDARWYSFLPRPGWYAGQLCGQVMVPVERLCKGAGVPECLAQSFIVRAQAQ